MRKFIAGTFATVALAAPVAAAAPAAQAAPVVQAATVQAFTVSFTPISPDSYGKAVSES